MPGARAEMHWPAGPEGSRALAWLAELAAGVRKVRPAEAGLPAGAGVAPEVLAAGFTHRVRGAVGEGFAGGGLLDGLDPGPDLADFAAQACADGLAALSDDELVGVLCAWRRLASWAMAGELAAVGELAGRRPAPGPCRDGHLEEEIAAALTLTGRSASRLTGLAAGLARLPGTAVLADETSLLADPAAAAVEERVLGGAPGWTTAQLRRACRRAVLAADPRAGIRRRQEAQKDARVEAWTETSGTGALAGRDLPPAEMIAADQAIDAQARWLRAHGVPGALEQLRARVFTAVLAGRSLDTLLPAPSPGTAAPGQPGSGPGASPGPGGYGAGGPGGTGGSGAGVGEPGGMGGMGAGEPGWAAAGWPGWPGLTGSVNLTMPLTAWLGLTSQPGEAAGLGPLDAETCRDLAALLAVRPGSRWCLTLTGPDGRAVAHGCARTSPPPPGPSPPAAGPPGARPPGTGPPGPPGGAGAWLAGITIGSLATGNCAHRRETPGYRPSAVLRHLIKIRDRRCAFPRCARQASRCDDDHTRPYQHGGRTCECNLAPLCRRHHRAKQAEGWRLDQPEPGTLVWTLPHGRSYTTTPDPYPV